MQRAVMFLNLKGHQTVQRKHKKGVKSLKMYFYSLPIPEIFAEIYWKMFMVFGYWVFQKKCFRFFLMKISLTFKWGIIYAILSSEFWKRFYLIWYAHNYSSNNNSNKHKFSFKLSFCCTLKEKKEFYMIWKQN